MCIPSKFVEWRLFDLRSGLIVFSLLSGFLAGCTPQEQRRTELRDLPPKQAETDPQVHVDKLPWETWSYGKTAEGYPMRNRWVLQADEQTASGGYKKALDLYSRAQPMKLTPEDREALTLRLASMRLALDQPAEALTLLSDYFKSLGRSESDVNASFSLLFGYAYGRHGEIDQSIAWFSRAMRVAAQDPSASGSAERGVRLLLRSLPEEEFNKTAAAWRSDARINSLLGQERRRRESPGYVVYSGSGSPFWQDRLPAAADEDGSAATAGEASGPKIGVLLPLSGQFAALGNAAKNGVELALESARSPDGRPALPNTAAVYRDYAGDSSQAIGAARELFESEKIDVLIGPLLADAAFQVAHIARQTGKTVVAFSKSADFQTGAGVLRLGPTAVSQVRSLVDMCQRAYGFSRYALVSPDDPNGLEYARMFKEELHRHGVTPVFEGTYDKNNLNGSIGIIDELEKVDVQAVFLPDGLKNASRFFSGLSAEARGRIHALGTASWDNLLELQQSGTALEGAIFVSPFFSQSVRPAISRFIEAYRNKFGRPPDFLAAQGFDAATMTLEALRRQRSGGGVLADAFSEVGLYVGLTGRIEVGSSGEMERQFAVILWRSGRAAELAADGAPEGERASPAAYADGGARPAE